MQVLTDDMLLCASACSLAASHFSQQLTGLTAFWSALTGTCKTCAWQRRITCLIQRATKAAAALKLS